MLLTDLFVKKCKQVNKEINILAIADLHCVDEEDLIKLKDVKYDVCLLLGDINSEYLNMIKKYVKNNIFGVLGNHDGFGILESANIENIHNKVVEINGIKIIGFQGSSKYKKGNHPLYTQEESIDIGKKMQESDILISHDSPYFLYKRDPAHCGLKGITKYIYKNRISINIHGHQHINSNVKLKNGTTVIGIYKCALINTKTKECMKIF